MFIQLGPESSGENGAVAPMEQRASGGAGLGCSADRPCGEGGGIRDRSSVAQSRVRAPLIVVSGPVRDRGAGVPEAEEQRLVQQLVPHAPVGLSQTPFCIGLPGAMKCQAIRFSLVQASIAFEVNSVP